MKLNRISLTLLITFFFLVINCYHLKAQELFIEHTIDNNFNGVCSVCSYDLDGDGILDVLAAANDINQIAWWKTAKDTAITFTRYVVETNATGIIYVDAADIDADNDLDILGASWQGDEVAIWLNNGGNPLSWEKVVVDDTVDRVHEVHGTFVDADTLIDIIAASGGDHQIIWYRNTGGEPIVWEKNIIDNQFTGARSVVCVDMDKDGHNDLVGAALNANQVSVWFNSGTSPVEWTKQIVSNNFSGAHWIHVSDLDKDNDPDILGAAYSVNQVAWWRNDGGTPIQWTKQIITSSFGGALSVSAADLDLDNDMDVFGAATIANKVSWWENDGNIPVQWMPHDLVINYYEAWPVFGIDFDYDGDTDILTAAATARRITLLENTTIITNVGDESYDNPSDFYLFQNYPNPFNPSTKIKYFVPRLSKVTIKVFDVLGNEIATLVNEEKPVGNYETNFNSAGLPSGVYLLKMTAGNFSSTIKMSLLK